MARPARRSAAGERGKPARERLTLIRIFEERRALGYESSYVHHTILSVQTKITGEVQTIGSGEPVEMLNRRGHSKFLPV